jgi:hypothetical protein
MLIASGTQNIYKTTLEWHGTVDQRSIITGHFAAVIPGILDDTDKAASAMAANYADLVGGTCSIPLGDLTATAELVSCTAGYSAPATIGPFAFLSAEDGAPLEAALRIQRVGAGLTQHSKGRVRIGPLFKALFTDPPRYRRIDLTNAALVSSLLDLNTGQPALFYGMQEVLWDRWTGDAITVDTWHCPVYTSRVWQRAGYPQGVRGPDRG